jgi:purine nucleoside permease
MNGRVDARSVADFARRTRFKVGATLFLIALAAVVVDLPGVVSVVSVAWAGFVIGFCFLPGLETVSRQFRAGYQETRESTNR